MTLVGRVAGVAGGSGLSEPGYNGRWSLGVAGGTGLSEPSYNGGRAGSASPENFPAKKSPKIKLGSRGWLTIFARNV